MHISFPSYVCMSLSMLVMLNMVHVLSRHPHRGMRLCVACAWLMGMWDVLCHRGPANWHLYFLYYHDDVGCV